MLFLSNLGFAWRGEGSYEMDSGISGREVVKRLWGIGTFVFGEGKFSV